MTLSELTAQFQGLANRRDLNANAALATTFINQGIMRVQRELRVPAMEKSILVTIDSTYQGLVIPNDLLEVINIIPQDDCYLQLGKVSIHTALLAARTTGLPQVYARQGGLWVLGPAPASGAVIRIDYYAELSPLVNPTDTNVITDIAWDLIVYAALSAAADYYIDNRASAWEARYLQIKQELQAQADADELGGSTAVQPSFLYPDDEY